MTRIKIITGAISIAIILSFFHFVINDQLPPLSPEENRGKEQVDLDRVGSVGYHEGDRNNSVKFKKLR